MDLRNKKDMQHYAKTAYPCWYSIGESNTDQSDLKPLQKGGFSHAARECNKQCNINESNGRCY